MESKKSIIGIGNALMDIVVKLPDDRILLENNLPKGSMILVDAETSENINLQTVGLNKTLVPGGSVANTVHGLASFGVRTAFIGKVGNDELGKQYANGLSEIGASPQLFTSSTPTGVAMALVTPDSERTFATYLGAAIEMPSEDITMDLFRSFDIAYVEGYLVQNHALIRKVVEMARKAGLIIAIDLASYNVVEENIDFLKEIIKDHIDIIFANEDEVKAFTGMEPEEAILSLMDICDIAVVKLGKQGSIIYNGTDLIRIGIAGTTCVDTTGAGDLYAAGFLYGLSCNFDLETCGRIAAITAGHVIKGYGARMDLARWDELISDVKKMFV
jgi:sugar/nucleoside kinase (ribokinase family)